MNHPSLVLHSSLRRLFFCLLFVILCGTALAPAQAAGYPPAESGIVLDINPGSADLTIDNYQQAGSLVYFVSGADLWVTDGSAPGTRLLLHSESDYLGYRLLASAGNSLYFVVWSPGSAPSWLLYITDGSQAGTLLLKSFGLEYGLSDFKKSVVLAGRLYFFIVHENTANIMKPWHELWVSGGTPGSAELLATVTSPVTYFDSIYFSTTTDGGLSYELWRTDWTAGGTEKVTFADGGSEISTILGRTRRGLLLMRNDNGLPNGDHGNELWYYGYQQNNRQLLPEILR